MKWTIFALLAFIITLMVVMYQNGKKAAQRQGERLRIEESNEALKADRDSIATELLNEKEETNYWKNKKQIKIIYREKIRTIIDTITDVSGRFRANGFHPVSPCK